MGIQSLSLTAGKRTSLSIGLAALVAGLGIYLNLIGAFGINPTANAVFKQGTATASTTPPAMNLTGSPDEKIDTDGTQGSFNAGDQCDSLSRSIACETNSPHAGPQEKATKPRGF
jgi:hypothetical protein